MARLLKAATILSVGGLVAGCSSDVIRFNDGFYTGAVPKQAVASAPDGYGQPNYNPGVDPSMTGSIPGEQVRRGPLPVPSDSQTRPPQPAGTVGAEAPNYTPSAGQQYPAAPQRVSPETTASVSPSPSPAPERFGTADSSAAAKANGQGWSSANATQVTLRQGETIYNLSRRYGVPAEAIMEANGISDATTVKAGQRISIPTYVYSQNVGVSAPDKNPNVAKASATVTNRQPASQNTAAPTQVASLNKPDTPTPARKAVVADGGRYTVVAGDSLYAISRRTGASVDAIKRVNGLDTDTVRIGQKLIIPGLTAENVASASTEKLDPIRTSSVERKPSKPAEVKEYTPPKQSAESESGSIRKIETAAVAKAPDSTGVNSMRWPVQGRITSAFGSDNGGRPNGGIDISVPQGTPVKAAENGVVIYAGDGLKELGKTILVRHSDGIVTVYGHVGEIDVKRGQEIKRGQKIASSGMSGAAKQPQLHFEVRKNSEPVNPTTYLQ